MEFKLLSSLEKCLPDQGLEAKKEFTRASALLDESYSFQLAMSRDDDVYSDMISATLTIESDIIDCISVRRVRHVPVMLAATPLDCNDSDYIRKGAGLYPDVLEPFDIKNYFLISAKSTETFWFTVEGAPDGIHDIKFTVTRTNGDVLYTGTFTLEVIGVSLPEQELVVTNWFHCDCLASYYNVEVFSERHWEIIENFVKNYVKNGMNLILTPILTPELDTEIGKERLTVQLVDIKVTNGVYRYNFKKLDRWIEMCQRNGIKYFEMAHLFSQWGANFAPKVMATVDGEYKRIFGWETESTGEDYKKFLKSFLKALIKHLKALGVDKQCFYHISDEPHVDHIKTYKACRNIVKNILKDYVIMDALSDFDFYKKGVVTTPIPANNHIEPFIKAEVPDLWTYYCCGQTTKVSNQFIAMPSARNRIIAEQFYKFNIYGFLQWGYNFYYSQLSRYNLNPYMVTDADGAFPAGDPFKVYPACDGTPLDSIRVVVFAEALQDLRAMKMLETITSREFVLNLIEEGAENPITFSEYPKCPCYILNLREKINTAIKERI